MTETTIIYGQQGQGELSPYAESDEWRRPAAVVAGVAGLAVGAGVMALRGMDDGAKSKADPSGGEK